MSFLKRLFGGGGDEGAGGDRVLGEESYEGFQIRAIEMKTGSEYQLCGEIIWQKDGEEPKVHRFIRADRLASPDQAEEFALRKGRQIIDQQGKSIFD